jgi:hypothetical protein
MRAKSRALTPPGANRYDTRDFHPQKETVMIEKHIIVGVHITDRVKHAPEVQVVFTRFGTNIKTRIGLHDVEEGFASPNGLLLVEFVGTDEQCQKMVSDLSEIEGVEVKTMVFDHP